MPKRKKQPTAVHKKLAKLLVRARAEQALQDDDELERQAAALVEQLAYATSGQRQSATGKNSPGRRGKVKVESAVLRAAVLAEHKRSPRLTFSDVCGKVGKRFGYESAWSTKQAALEIKWSDPRREHK